MEKTTESVQSDAKVYEVGYLIVPSVPEEKVGTEVDAIKALIAKNGGDIIAHGDAKLIPLAYMMRKVVAGARHSFTEGYFGWVKFTMSPETIKEVKTALDVHDHVLRFLLINTVRENTYIGQTLEKEIAAAEGEVVAQEGDEVTKPVEAAKEA